MKPSQVDELTAIIEQAEDYHENFDEDLVGLSKAEESVVDLGLDDKREEEILLNSFLEPYLIDKDYTDISFNGTELRVQHNVKGRIKPEVQPTADEVERLIKSIADNRKTEFTTQKPVLDEIGRAHV